jgi:hypothetical protein
MKNTLLSLFVALVATNISVAQSNVKNFFSARLDSLVALYSTPSIGDEDMTDIAFYRLFAPTLLYESTVERGMSQGFVLPERKSESGIELDESRSVLIDGILLDVYKNYPLLVEMTEEDLRSVLSSEAFRNTQAAPEISLKENTSVAFVQNVDTALKVKKVKLNYWRTSGDFNFNFTQNYIKTNYLLSNQIA